MNEKELFNTINYEVLSIENELKAIAGEGIYFAPELYIGFRISKAIFLNRKRIFNNKSVNWYREIKKGDSGPSDIVFEIHSEDQKKTVMIIELKLRSTYDAYERDVLKLKRMNDIEHKYFCVLLDSFTETNDDRITKLYNLNDVSLESIGHDSFPTKQDWYTSQIYCNVNLLRVN